MTENDGAGRLLILGGTRFIGPHLIRAARARGYRVTVLNRGETAADLPRDVEHIVADRSVPLPDLGDGTWDIAVDLSAFGPGWVRSAGEALADRVGQYVFVSTNAVYAHPELDEPTTEDAEVLEYHGDVDPYEAVVDSLESYGSLKILAEREAERWFPGRTLVARPCWIFGPGDDFAPSVLLPARIATASEVLVAGDRNAPVQFIDVRDLAAWLLDAAARRVTGVFNTIGPTQPTTLGHLLEGLVARYGVSPELTWVPAGWFAERPEAGSLSDILFWTDRPGGYGHLSRMSAERAIGEGLSTRPAADTLADAAAALPGGVASVSISPERAAAETAVLAAWRTGDPPR